MRKINYPTSGIQYVGLSVMQELFSMNTVEIHIIQVCVCVCVCVCEGDFR